MPKAGLGFFSCGLVSKPAREEVTPDVQGLQSLCWDCVCSEPVGQGSLQTKPWVNHGGAPRREHIPKGMLEWNLPIYQNTKTCMLFGILNKHFCLLSPGQLLKLHWALIFTGLTVASFARLPHLCSMHHLPSSIQAKGHPYMGHTIPQLWEDRVAKAHSGCNSSACVQMVLSSPLPVGKPVIRSWPSFTIHGAGKTRPTGACKQHTTGNVLMGFITRNIYLVFVSVSGTELVKPLELPSAEKI